MKNWKPIENVPRETPVKVKTVRGIVCKAKVPWNAKFKKPDRYYGEGKRIAAKRSYPLRPGMVGDIVAVAWK